MKNKKILLLSIQLLFLAINGFTDQVKSSISSECQPAFKISVYKKDPKNPEGQIFCDQLLISDMTKNIFITCHNNGSIEYLLFSGHVLEDDNNFTKVLKLLKKSKRLNETAFYFSKDPLGMALAHLKYSKIENKFLKKVYNNALIETEKTINDNLVFAKNNFIAVLEEI